MGGEESADDGAFHEGDGFDFRWMFENRDLCVEFLANEMKLKPSHARKGWEFYTQTRYWPPDGDVTLEGLKNNIRFYAEQTGAKNPCLTRASMWNGAICSKR